MAVIAVETSVKLRFERSNFVEETAMTKESMAFVEYLRQQGGKDFLKGTSNNHHFLANIGVNRFQCAA
jgi:hypothetical protein